MLTEGAYDPAVHLSMGDVAVDNTNQPTLLRIAIKQSKTDTFCRGVNLFVGRTQSVLCLVAAVLDYLCIRGTSPGPLFILAGGCQLTQARFAEEVCNALSRAVDRSQYCTHCFRIGAVTTVAAKGIEDLLIKTLGWWESTAYLQYVRVPRSQLTGVSSQLAL